MTQRLLKATTLALLAFDTCRAATANLSHAVASLICATESALRYDREMRRRQEKSGRILTILTDALGKGNPAEKHCPKTLPDEHIGYIILLYLRDAFTFFSKMHLPKGMRFDQIKGLAVTSLDTGFLYLDPTDALPRENSVVACPPGPLRQYTCQFDIRCSSATEKTPGRKPAIPWQQATETPHGFQTISPDKTFIGIQGTVGKPSQIYLAPFPPNLTQRRGLTIPGIVKTPIVFSTHGIIAFGRHSSKEPIPTLYFYLPEEDIATKKKSPTRGLK